MRLIGVLILSIAASATLTLEERYGRVPRSISMRPRGASLLSKASSGCRQFPLRIALLQDLTDSFSDDIEQMRAVQFPQMQKDLSTTHPGSQVAIVTFKDKPISPFGVVATAQNGWYSDYCATINSPMTRIEEKNASDIYGRLASNGGGDAPENSFGAMLLAAQSKQLGWNATTKDARNLFVVVTDAPPHFEGDGDNTLGLPASSGLYTEEDMSTPCLKEYYPSPEQVAGAIRSLNAYVAFVIYDAEGMSGLTGRSWLWFNRYINQTDDFITLQAKDSSNFWLRLGQIIQTLEDIECKVDVVETTTLPVTTQMNCTDSDDDDCRYSYRIVRDGLIVKSQSPVQGNQIIFDTEEVSSNMVSSSVV